MALGKEIGDFSFKITSVSYPDDQTATVDCDGTASGFGTVLGTLSFTLSQPGATRGALNWRGQSFLDSGEALQVVGDGAYEEVGQHKWRTRLVISVSDGQIFASDGQLDLASRSLAGKLLEWS